MPPGPLMLALTAFPSHQEADGEVVILDAAGEAEAHRVHVACEVEPVGTRLHVQARVDARATSRCHRCLSEFERRVASEFRLLLQRGGTSADDEVVVVAETATEYDLLPRVRESLILEEPIQLHCRPDCRGLCPQCGQDLNRGECGCTPPSDPRWHALERLRADLEG